MAKYTYREINSEQTRNYKSKFNFTAWKVSKYRVFCGSYFSVFGLNTVIYSVNLRIQSGYWKIRTRKNSIFRHFSRSVRLIKFSLGDTLNYLKTWGKGKIAGKAKNISFSLNLSTHSCRLRLKWGETFWANNLKSRNNQTKEL